MDQEYYTREEAARELSFHIDKIDHFLETGKLLAHIFLVKTPVIFAERYNTLTQGRGTGVYTGLAIPPQDFIFSLLHAKKSTLEELLVLVNPKGISEYSEEHSFKSELFLKKTAIGIWNPIEQEYLKDCHVIHALPYPSEHKNLMPYVQSQLKKYSGSSNNQEKEITLADCTDYSYSFATNGTFSKDDIRILDIHLELFTSSSKDDSSLPTIKIENDAQVNSTQYSIERERNSGLQHLFIKVMQKNPKANSQDIWNILRNDIKTIPREYDVDEIIISMNKEKIHWISSHGHQIDFKHSSLAPTISRLKKELNNKH